MKPIAFASAAALLTLAACSGGTEQASNGKGAETAGDVFFASLSSHCGKAFSGKLVSDDPADADFGPGGMVMHVKECSDDKIVVPLHVMDDHGKWDRSRTWLITREGEKLRLKHDHRHEDGEEDAVTMYGGDTVEAGTKRAQHFIVDPESIALFKEQDLPDSVTNVWTIEVDDADAETPKYAYQLKRTIEGGAPKERLFRVEFDLGQEVEAPPAAWGHEG